MSEIKDVKKQELTYLGQVYNYMNRTIGVIFINNVNDLENTWEDAQFELSTKYQYEGINEHVWDYYLVLCCNFGVDDLDKRLRFKIESNRFCCRKYFMFGVSKSAFTKHKLIDRLFPSINSSKSIQLIKSETIIDKLGDQLKTIVPPSFFTEAISASAVEPLLESIIAKNEQPDDE